MKRKRLVGGNTRKKLGGDPRNNPPTELENDRGPITNVLIGPRKLFNWKDLRGLEQSHHKYLGYQFENIWLLVWSGRGYTDLSIVTSRADAERELKFLLRGNPQANVEWLKQEDDDGGKSDSAPRRGADVPRRGKDRHRLEDLRDRITRARKTLRAG